jgi:hypothetical protein
MPMDDQRQFSFLFTKPFKFWFPKHSFRVYGEDEYAILRRSKSTMLMSFNGSEPKKMPCIKETTLFPISRASFVVGKEKTKDKYYPALPN